ncbi:Hypothetical protein POVN_LOCUS473 [uncultured virus]|nr:Hypothetical protein POVN_LOCUS473 [uncultured virus]
MYIASSVRGLNYTEAKERVADKAFLHIVTWAEYKPHLAWLKERRPDLNLSVEDEVDTPEAPFDASWSDVGFMCDEVATLLTTLLKVRYAKGQAPGLKRGDCVRVQFVRYRQYGIYFYDGTKVILPANEDSDYYAVPAEFKVPTEFSITYWDDTGFPGYAKQGDFCFDIKAVLGDEKPTFQLRCVHEDDNFLVLTNTVPYKGKYHFFIQLEAGSKDENGDPQPPTPEEVDVQVKQVLERFLATGRCYNIDHLCVEHHTEDIEDGLSSLELPDLETLKPVSFVLA